MYIAAYHSLISHLLGHDCQKRQTQRSREQETPSMVGFSTAMVRLVPSIVAALFRCLPSIVMLLVAARPGPARDSGMFRGDLRRTGAFNTPAPRTLKGVKWKYPTSGPVRSSPVMAGGVIYFGSGDGNLYAVAADSAETIWKFNAKASVQSTPAVADGVVYFLCADGVFYALDQKTGVERWRLEAANHRYEGGWDYFGSSPAVYNDVVFFGSGDGNLYAVDSSSGAIKWKF